MRVSPTVLVAVSAVAFPLALTAPLYSLLLLDVLLVPFQGQTQIGGVLLDPSDVIFAALTFGILVRKRLTFREIRKQVPFFGVWITLGLLMSVAYLTADKYQQHLTAIHRIIYQVYRFGWKPILLYPLSALLLNDIKGTRHALTAVVLAGNICALMALPQGLRGMKAAGPFGSGNSLGAALVVPFVICFGSIILETSRRSRWFYGLSLLLLGRVLLWTGSRGATAGAVVGTCAVVAVLLAGSRGRSRFLRFVPVGLAAVLILFALKPDLLTRPTVRRAMTISNPMEENTMQWRIENRWGFFWEKALKSPWFGYGIDVDEELSRKGGAKTPHNGYLSLLVTYGFPATILYVSLALFAMGRAILVSRQPRLQQVSSAGLLIAAGLAGILTHNAVESVFTNTDWVNSVYWLLTGLGMISMRLSTSVPNATRESVEPAAESVQAEPAISARGVIMGSHTRALEE